MVQDEEKTGTVSRRKFLKATGLCCAVLMAGEMIPALARNAVAGVVGGQEAVGDGGDIKAVLRARFGDRRITMVHVDLKVPIIAENGAVVPVKIVSDLPMEHDNYVKKLYLFVDGNSNPYIASAMLSPANGKADLQMKIKMRKTSNVRAVAEMSDGSLYGDIKSVKVTIGGCGG